MASKLLFLGLIAFLTTNVNAATPIVLWHGMGDTCCNPISLGYVKRVLQTEIPNVYVNSVEIGGSILEDVKSGYYGNVNDQVAFVCRIISADPQLQNGYNAIGFSQGGQFLRAVAERCPSPAMKVLVSIGGQHQGVYGLPHCPGESKSTCDMIRRMLNYGAYSEYMQSHLVQAQYWHDPLQENEYSTKNLFLADINNQKSVKDEYKKNLQRLDKLILIQFNNDSMVDPKESSTFGWYQEGQGKIVVDMRETRLYKEDWIGLKDLDETGRLVEYYVDGDHLQLDMDWFKAEIIDKFLK